MDQVEYKTKQWKLRPQEIVLDNIQVTCQNTVHEINVGLVSPLNIAKKHKMKNVVAAKTNDEVSDAWYMLEKSCNLTFNDEEGKKVYWHSSAHILGCALEKLYKCQVCIGPAIDNGFNYDVKLPVNISLCHYDIANNICNKYKNNKKL